MGSFYTSVERYGNNILWRGYENGRSFSRKVKFQPTIFTNTQSDTEWRSLIGNKPIAPKLLESMSAAKDYIEQYKDVHGVDIFGNTNMVAQFIQEKYPNKINFDMSKINILSFDIEVDIEDGKPDMEVADKPITSIAVKSSKRSTYYLLGLKDYDKTKTITGIDPNDIMYMKCDTEEELLVKFIKIWTYEYPDIVTGWNVEYFDIQYIITRIIRLFSQEKANELSPWGVIKKKSMEKFGRKQYSYEIFGVSVIDYMDVFKKFGYKYGTQESYKLDHIAHVVLGEKKLDYSEYGTLTELYKKNPQLYLDYNLKDTHLIERFEEETAMLSLTLTVAYSGGVNYSDAFGTVGIWESTLYRKLMLKNLVPNIKMGAAEITNELVGGYVKEPIPNMYKWVVSFDLNSLYPHLMLQYNMSPETFVRDKKIRIPDGYKDLQELVLSGQYQNDDKRYSVCANGACFTNEVLGIIPEIIDEYYSNRKKIKNEMLSFEQQLEVETDPAKRKELKREITQFHNAQMAIKISMNSLYGATANKYFLYFIGEMAEAITTSGQLSIRYAQKSINAYMNKIMKTTDVDYIIYCVDKDTKLHINGLEETISSLYDRIDVSELDGVKNIQDRDIFVLSYNIDNGKREYKRATAVIKRTATKKMYKVWIDDEKFVVVSEDHRFIVKRDGSIVESTVKDLLENDVFINIHGYTKEGTYQCMKSVTAQDGIV